MTAAQHPPRIEDTYTTDDLPVTVTFDGDDTPIRLQVLNPSLGQADSWADLATELHHYTNVKPAITAMPGTAGRFTFTGLLLVGDTRYAVMVDEGHDGDTFMVTVFEALRTTWDYREQFQVEARDIEHAARIAGSVRLRR